MSRSVVLQQYSLVVPHVPAYACPHAGRLSEFSYINIVSPQSVRCSNTAQMSNSITIIDN